MEPARTIELLVRDASAGVAGEDLVRWAEDALVAGFDTTALRRLAGLGSDGPATRFEAMPLFERALQELGFRRPDSPEALRREFLARVAADIEAGIRAPAEALEVIHYYVISPLNHPSDLMPWCYLWEGLHPETFAPLGDEAVADATKALARRTGAEYRSG